MRVVATLSTLPGRYDKLVHTLKSLHAQSHPLDAIYLTVPTYVQRLNITYPPLPSAITSQCTVITINHDYGPITKLLGALLSESDPDTFIVSVDDDIIYPMDMVSKLIANQAYHPGSVTSVGGYNFNGSFCHLTLYQNKFPRINWFTFPHIPVTGRRIEQVYGFSGVLYQRSHFTDYEHMLEKAESHRDLFLNDDVVISAWLARHHIDIYTYPNFTSCNEQNETRDGNELSYVPTRMYLSMQRAYRMIYEWGFAHHPFPDQSFTDSPFGFVIALIILLLVMITLIAITWYVTHYFIPLSPREQPVQYY